MNKNKEKLLIITNLYPLPWEPQRATFNRQQFSYLEKSFDIKIIVPIAWPEYYKNKISIPKEARNVKYIPYYYLPKMGRRLNGDFMYHSVMATSKEWITSFSPNKILASWVFPDGMVAKKLAKKLNIPYFIKVHGSDINAHCDNKVRVDKIKAIANNSSGILSVSNALAEKMIHIGVRKELIQTIYNGVDKTLFFPTSNGSTLKSKKLLFIGNLKAEKGIKELIEAFATASKNHPGIHLQIAGTGNMNKYIVERCDALNILDKVELLGAVNHTSLPALINQSLLLVLPSYAEGVPNVILESLSCGKPVVATNVGGIPEVITDGINGFLTPPKCAKSLAYALDKALKNKWCSDTIFKTALPFDWETNHTALKKLLTR
jgi:glycosyltransferase involved in cell wall biosynthesis